MRWYLEVLSTLEQFNLKKPLPKVEPHFLVSLGVLSGNSMGVPGSETMTMLVSMMKNKTLNRQHRLSKMPLFRMKSKKSLASPENQSKLSLVLWPEYTAWTPRWYLGWFGSEGWDPYAQSTMMFCESLCLVM